jgi:hypothetical protein
VRRRANDGESGVGTLGAIEAHEPAATRNPMPRIYLPLVPVALAAAIAAASACSEPRGVEGETRVIPPAAPLALAAEPAPAKPEVLAAAAPAAAPEAPSAEDVREFERKVAK